MERYFSALNKTRGKLLSLKNVVGVGIGFKNVGEESTGEPAFIVYVEKKIRSSDLHRSHIVPKKINGLDTDVVEIGRVKMLDIRTSRERPCMPGVSIGHYQSTAGTLGAVVRDKKTKDLMILSNNHVMANGSSFQEIKAKIGDPILQPGPYDGGKIEDRIATLYRFIPLAKSVSVSDCPVASGVAKASTRALQLFKRDYELRFYKNYKTENTVDCAVAKLDSKDLVLPAILEIGSVTGVAEAKPGMMVMKSGRTTGLTSGKVKSIGTTLQVEMKDDEKVWFADQVVTDMSSQPGDSGSLVVGMDRKVVGLLFAGSDTLTVFNRINNVMDRLGVEPLT